MYCKKITDIFAHMFSLRKSVLPENRYWVDFYLHEVWHIGAELTMAMQRPDDVPEWLEGKFADYVIYEENRIDSKLKEFQYDIDALDTVYIVASPERVGDKARVRIEKVSAHLDLTLLCVLLTKHMEHLVDRVLLVIFALEDGHADYPCRPVESIAQRGTAELRSQYSLGL